jgi:hypothetical protein
MRKAIICLMLAALAVSAQQKQRGAVLPSVGDLDPQRLILLTDKVREIATKNLPIENFNILKQDVITKMIGEEELYRSCKEGVCIGDLAKKTNANYGARCDVVKLDDGLVLKFELYSVNEDAIFETFTDYDTKDFRGMLAVLEARLPDVFKKMVGALERELARDKEKERQQQEAKTNAQTVEEYKLTPQPEPSPAEYAVQPKQQPQEQQKPEQEKVIAGSARKTGSAKVKSVIDKSMDFTTGERWGTWALNIVPGLGSAVIMKDYKGAIINASLAGSGIVMIFFIAMSRDGDGHYTIRDYNTRMTIGEIGGVLGVGVGSAWNIYRSITYHHPDSRILKSAANPLQGLNVAVLPDQDGNIKGYVAYRVEF